MATQAQIDGFVKLHLKDATQAGNTYHLERFALLAHAALESGYGTSYQARHNNAYFGITSGNKPANTYWGGNTYTSPVTHLTFRVYDNSLNSFMDAALLLSAKYIKSLIIGGDAVAYFTAIANSKYISEANGDNRQSYLDNYLIAVTRCTQSAKAQNLISNTAMQEVQEAGFSTPAKILIGALAINLLLSNKTNTLTN